MDTPASEATPEPPVVFRGKKRKTYRQRAEATGNDEVSKSVSTPQTEQPTTTSDSPPKPDGTASTPIQSEDAVEEEEKGLSVAEILRRRNVRKSRLGGVKFGAGNNHSPGDATAATADRGNTLDDLTLMIREEENKAMDIAAGVKKRFAVQTGLATEVINKHMEEYIEAELAKRHNAIASSSSTQAGAALGRLSSQEPRASEAEGSTAAPGPGHRNRALQGQLMEIDLGDEARSRNEALTERATRRLQGQATEDEEQGAPPRKIRLGKDGKPWRPRNRRNSDDIRRDQLVEEILRENRLDVYETPTPPPAGPSAADGEDEDGAADDRIAEEFRREFMDALAERQKKRKKPSNAPPSSNAAKGAAKNEDVLKGPKLGGSRNVRAAMRNLLLEKAKEAKKPGK
ncbi:hypothetical protein GGR54DRAFT_585731 [Hypoxylon sp. NC1633]|nr:hypothetical protein GGR54DRAFT_585731 [Hypoxylon sp. NC1633]